MVSPISKGSEYLKSFKRTFQNLKFNLKTKMSKLINYGQPKILILVNFLTFIPVIILLMTGFFLFPMYFLILITQLI